MSQQIKNSVTIVTFTAILIPFILLTDLFPFLRFGMFAEPVKHRIQTEHFLVTMETDRGTFRFDPEQVGLPDETFHYLARNYLYRDQQEEFLQKLSRSVDDTVITWAFYRITFPVGRPESADTSLVTTYHPAKEAYGQE